MQDSRGLKQKTKRKRIGNRRRRTPVRSLHNNAMEEVEDEYHHHEAGQETQILGIAIRMRGIEDPKEKERKEKGNREENLIIPPTSRWKEWLPLWHEP